MSNDLDFCSFSYTNEPQENVWLGNKFTNDETFTLQSVEVQWDIYLLDPDFVTIEILNADEEVVAVSEPFFTQRDSIMTIDMPNITIHEDFFLMVHWQNNVVNTHSLCIDWTNGIENTAYIKYSDQPAELLTDFLGNLPGAFILRANVLKAGNNDDSGPKSYNIFRGSPDDMANVND